MKIVLAGAGNVGFHLAQLLSYEKHDLILIDIDQDVLDYASAHLDVITIKGDATSIDVLQNANIEGADLMLAVTTSEKTNLVSAILAKQLGAKKTVARVSNPEYLEKQQKNTFKQVGIDNLISPRQLAAKEIARLIDRLNFTDFFEFEEGKIHLAGITVDNQSPISGVTLKDLPQYDRMGVFRPIAILRDQETIMPTGKTTIRAKDHIYFITKKENLDEIMKIVGLKNKKVKKIMIAGSTDLSFETAKLLEKKYQVILVSSKKEKCKLFSEKLEKTLIIHGDENNIDLLEEEGLSDMDAFIALTPNSETNIITSLTADKHGVFKTIALVENKEYVHISQNIGIDTLINKKLIAANNIFRFVRKGHVEAITTLHGVNAEIIEYVIEKENTITRKILRECKLPKGSIIGGVIRGNNSYIPSGNFQLKVDDKIIVFALPGAIPKLEEIFN